MLNRIGRKFGVQSKFLALVLFASLASLLLTGFVSFAMEGLDRDARVAAETHPQGLTPGG
jgi:hypothetical protein